MICLLVLIYFYCTFIVHILNNIVILEIHFQIFRDIFPIFLDIVPILIFLEIIAEQFANIFLWEQNRIAHTIISLRDNNVCNCH